MPLPLIIRKNIKDNEAKKEANLQKLESILGTAMTFECDFEALYETCEERWKNTLGEVVYEKYLAGLAKNFAQKMTDEMVVEAFLEAVTTKKITITVQPFDKGFVKSAIIDGVYNIVVRKGKFPCNFDQAGEDVMEIL